MQLASTLALIALVAVFVLSIIVSAATFSKGPKLHPLQNYLLAGGGLNRPSIISLLLSSSFGLNALFYAAWLGYAIGMWALVIQIAWSASFFLLAPHVSIIRERKSLHELLALRFGRTTRVVAGLCSVIGIMYLIGWEVGIGRATIAGLIETTGSSPSAQATISAEWLIGGVVFGCLLYTIIGGLRGNASADIVQNLLKIIILCFLTYLLFERFVTQPQVSFWNALFPPFETVAKTLGWWGLLTNVMFNLAWQFVDTSTWQSIIGGAKASTQEIAQTVRLSGLSIFLVPNLIATVLGASLVGTQGIDPNNILVNSVSLVPNLSWFILLLVFVAVTASVMSLIDGCFLASAYALIIDVIHPNENVADLDMDLRRAKRLLLGVRLGLIALAVAAIWGVRTLLDQLELNLFDFVYIVVITQLALLGPVIMALLSNRTSRFPLWISIIVALIIGFGSVYIGTVREYRWAIDGAGTFTILASCLLAFVATKRGSTIGGGRNSS